MTITIGLWIIPLLITALAVDWVALRWAVAFGDYAEITLIFDLILAAAVSLVAWGAWLVYSLVTR